jgi:hypothetical protein
MINIKEYSPFFINRSFNLQKFKPIKKKVKKVKMYDYLFYEIFHKINNIDELTNINRYNEIVEKTKLSELINNIKIKKKEYILNNLMYEPTISLTTLDAIIKCYDNNVIYVNNNVYFKMCYNQNKPLIVINNEYKFIDIIDFTHYYEITNLEKPLNSISYYKLPELIEISMKLNLPYDKIKKVDLYNSIYNYLVKLNIFKID